MAWEQDLYPLAGTPLVDDEGGATGLIDPRTINWLRELLNQEGNRLATLLFGDNAAGRFHLAKSVYSPWDTATPPSTPALYAIMGPPARSTSWPGAAGQQSVEYGDEGKYVVLDQPQMYDITVTWRIVIRTEYPLFALEQALMNGLGKELSLLGETVAIRLDAPAMQWSPNADDALASDTRVVYAQVPYQWGTTCSFGSVINEVTLDLREKAEYDEAVVGTLQETLKVE
jgi:hypothetical protein